MQAHLVDELCILQIFYSLLQHRQRLIEVDRQADAAEILADALLQDGPQADALLLLLGGWQGLTPGGRGLHLPVIHNIFLCKCGLSKNSSIKITNFISSLHQKQYQP